MQNSWKYDVCVVGGLGHVGLPFGLAIANTGQRVMLNDINEKALDTVAQGKMPFLELGAEELLKKVLGKNLFISSNPSVISESKIIVVIIGTPVDEHLNPTINQYLDFLNSIMPQIQNGQHILLRSTIYPGTSEKVHRLLECAGKKVGFSFCPERVVEGKAIEEIANFPQIVSAFDDESYLEAETLFKQLTNDVIRLSPLEAELAKIFTNTWRYISFAISNQLYEISTANGVDFYRIHNALTYRYPRCKEFALAGFTAGPCLLKDTMQLAAFSNNIFFLGHSAMLVNEGLPNFVVDRLKAKYDLSQKNVGILGMAFKPDNDDKRESLSYKLKKMLEPESKRVLCTDVYIIDERFVSLDHVLKESDILIVGVPHKEYRELEIPSHIILVDVWNTFQRGGLF